MMFRRFVASRRQYISRGDRLSMEVRKCNGSGTLSQQTAVNSATASDYSAIYILTRAHNTGFIHNAENVTSFLT